MVVGYFKMQPGLCLYRPGDRASPSVMVGGCVWYTPISACSSIILSTNGSEVHRYDHKDLEIQSKHPGHMIIRYGLHTY